MVFEELSVISLTYEAYKKLLTINTVIDKKYRHTLGEPSCKNCGELPRYLILAKHAPKQLKASYIIQADSHAELLALNIRAMLELKLTNETNLLKLQAKLTEARRQLGGWRKSIS